MSTLYRETQDLQQMTRSKGIPERQELTLKKEELVELLEQEKKLAFHIVNRGINGVIIWEMAGQSSKRKKNASFIPKIKNDKGEMVYSSPKIANVFHSYYSSLYNMSSRGENGGR